MRQISHGRLNRGLSWESRYKLICDSKYVRRSRSVRHAGATMAWAGVWEQVANHLAPLAGLWRSRTVCVRAPSGPLERLGIACRRSEPPAHPAHGGGWRRLLQCDHITQITLILMIAPAATAGAICQDRSSGKLAQLLATDLSDTEILLGKLAARLVPVLGLVCCALPVLALVRSLGGVDPLALAGAFLITVGLAIFGCTLALTFSVWASKPYEVLLATYAVLAVWMLALPVWDFLGHCWRCPTSPDWAIPFNPFYLAFAPYVQPGKVGVLGFLAFFAAILTLSAGLAGLAIGKMRAVIIGQAGHSAVQRPAHMRWFGIGPAPSLEGNPVLWYETRRKQPSSWVRTLIRGYFVVAVVFSLFAIDTSMRLRSVNAPYLSAYVVAFEVAIGLPLVLISSATAVVEERARGSLDLLLATPLSTRQIVLAKWWGAFQNLPRLLLLPMLVAIAAAWPSGPWLIPVCLVLFVVSAAAFWTSIGLASRRGSRGWDARFRWPWPSMPWSAWPGQSSPLPCSIEKGRGCRRSVPFTAASI